MEPMRILHIVHSLNRGGMESRIMDLYRNLDRNRFQYDFYVEAGKQGVFDEEVIRLGGRVFLSKGSLKHNIPNFRAFYTFIKEHPEYQVVNAYNQWSGEYLKQAEKRSVPYRIANARTSLQKKTLKNAIKNFAKRNVNKYATHRFAVSKKAAIWLFGEKHTNDGEVQILPNAIDTKKYAFSEEVRSVARQELGLKTELIVMHIGNIRFEKNHPFLLRVFAEIKKKQKNAKLVLVGRGDIETLSLQMEELGIEKSVIYLGVREDIERLLQAGDLFIFPSLYEGFPGAVLEAEASGLKCLISDSITNEVMLTDHIEMMSLSDAPEQWAVKALEGKDFNRGEAWKEIKDAGYDIRDLCNWTAGFYDSLQ